MQKILKGYEVERKVLSTLDFESAEADMGYKSEKKEEKHLDYNFFALRVYALDGLCKAGTAGIGAGTGERDARVAEICRGSGCL